MSMEQEILHSWGQTSKVLYLWDCMVLLLSVSPSNVKGMTDAKLQTLEKV